MIVYQRERFTDCYEDLYALVEPHYAEIESEHERLPLDLDKGRYISADQAGILLLVTARDTEKNNKMCAYYCAFVSYGLHSKKHLTCYTDAFYVLPDYRLNRTGLHLFENVKLVLKLSGVSRWLMSSFPDHDASPLFKKIGARHHEDVYSMWLGD